MSIAKMLGLELNKIKKKVVRIPDAFTNAPIQIRFNYMKWVGLLNF